MKKILNLTVLLLLLLNAVTYSQKNSGSIAGKVIDNDSKAPIEYANVVLLNPQTSAVLNGTITDTGGKFLLKEVKPGTYTLEVRFIGYTTKSYSVEVTPQKLLVSLGDISISPSSLKMNDVVVKGDRTPVSYQIDKKVIEVDKMQTVVSGNAADVLQNVPSVTVDIEGNVSLRGSSNFTVLIDGRPTVMSAQDALQQIPASSLETIEIITNPSAKYDPEGTAGIINIILKKNQNLGLSGVVNGNAGLKKKYGGDALLQYRTEDIIYTLGLDFNKRTFPGSSKQENKFYSANSTSFYNYNGSTEWGRLGFGARAGIEFNFNEEDFFNIGGRIGKREGERKGSRTLQNWATNSLPVYSTDYNNNSRNGQFAGANLSYVHKFETKGHELSAEINFGYEDGTDSASTETVRNNSILSGKKTSEYGPSRELEAKIDYVLPFSDVSKFEAGYESEFENTDELNDLYEYSPVSGAFEFKSLFSYATKYQINDQSFYTMYSNEFGDFGIQGGLRAEYSFRKIKLLRQNSQFSIDRWDFFPTLHTSYKFSEGTQVMASYTRRIQRPWGGQLEPFLTWMDATNVRIGNPDLLPEFIDSYEAGIQTFIGEFTISGEVYHRFTSNKIEDIRSVYEENVTLNSVANIGKDYSTGGEFMVIVDPVSFWNLNMMANLYDYKIKGNLYGESFTRSSFNWNARINNMFKISATTSMQINFNYNSPSVSSQGTWEASYSTDLSVKQDLFEKKLSLTLQVRDLFGTGKWETTSSGPDFYTYGLFKRESPIVVLNLKWNFNNYQPNKEKRDTGGQSDREEF